VTTSAGLGDDRRVTPCLLRPLRLGDEAQARRAHAELQEDDFTFLVGAGDLSWPEYLAKLEGIRRGDDVPPGFVPATFLVADVDGVIIGRTSVRHRLNESLSVVGGHIGYCVRRDFRRRGYATAILRASLALAGEHGIEHALVTCDDDNVGSAAVIERCGGVLETVVADPGTGRRSRRYWVPTSISASSPVSAAGC
jgi:predicted acetyltransferase